MLQDKYKGEVLWDIFMPLSAPSKSFFHSVSPFRLLLSLLGTVHDPIDERLKVLLFLMDGHRLSSHDMIGLAWTVGPINHHIIF